MLAGVLATLTAILAGLQAPRTPSPVPGPAQIPSPAPGVAQEPRNPSAKVITTAYCLSGRMADGRTAYVGAVASNRHPLGTRLHLSDSPHGPGDFTVADRIGWGTELDVAMPGDCRGARRWGRRLVTVSAD